MVAPLSTLEVRKKYSFENYTYPLDLLDNKEYNHFIVININTVQEAKFFLKNEATKAFVSNVYDENSSGQQSNSLLPNSDERNQILENDPTSLRQTTIAQQGNLSSPKGIFASGTQRTKGAIALPFPKNILNNYATQWGEETLSFASRTASVVANALGEKGIVDAMQEGVGQFGKDVKDVAAGAVLQKTGLSRLSQIAINPHKEQFFEGVGFRTFDFSWELVARNEKEANAIMNIINALRYHSAPYLNNPKQGRFFSYPDEFDCRFFSNGHENEYIKRISSCALTNISINYTPNGFWTAIREGFPAQLELQTTWLELQKITRSDVLQGY